MAIPFEDIERAAAPSRDVFVTRYLRPRRPVILSGLTDGWLPPAEWTAERMAREYVGVYERLLSGRRRQKSIGRSTERVTL